MVPTTGKAAFPEGVSCALSQSGKPRKDNTMARQRMKPGAAHTSHSTTTLDDSVAERVGTVINADDEVISLRCLYQP